MKVGDRVKVVCDNEGGGEDDWAVGLDGTLVSIDGDYAEVSFYGEAKTYQFALYQLTKCLG